MIIDEKELRLVNFPEKDRFDSIKTALIVDSGGWNGAIRTNFVARKKLVKEMNTAKALDTIKKEMIHTLNTELNGVSLLTKCITDTASKSPAKILDLVARLLHDEKEKQQVTTFAPIIINAENVQINQCQNQPIQPIEVLTEAPLT